MNMNRKSTYATNLNEIYLWIYCHSIDIEGSLFKLKKSLNYRNIIELKKTTGRSSFMMYLVKVRKINILGHFFNDVPNYKEVKIIVENINLFLSNYFITISINGFKLPMLLYYVKSYIWSVIVQFFWGGLITKQTGYIMLAS